MTETLDMLFDMGISSEAAIWFFVIQFPVWVWSIIYVARKRTKDATDRIVWLLVILFLGILGTILYFIFGREPKFVKESESEDATADFEKWKYGDPSRAYLSSQDQQAAFEEYQKQNKNGA